MDLLFMEIEYFCVVGPSVGPLLILKHGRIKFVESIN